MSSSNHSKELSIDNYHECLDYTIAGLIENGFGNELEQTSVCFATEQRAKTSQNNDVTGLTNEEKDLILSNRLNVSKSVGERTAFELPDQNADESVDNFLVRVKLLRMKHEAREEKLSIERKQRNAHAKAANWLRGITYHKKLY